MNFQETAKRKASSVLDWLERRGKRAFNPESFKFYLFLIFLYIILAIGLVFVLAVTGNLAESIIMKLPNPLMTNAFANFCVLIAVLLLLSLGLLYLLKMRQYTFKNEPFYRATLLKWDSWGGYFQSVFFIANLVLTVAVLVVLLLNIQSKALNFEVNEFTATLLSIPIRIASAFVFSTICLYLTLSLRMTERQKIAYCSDYLTRTQEFVDRKPQKELRKDTNLVAEKFGEKINRTVLLDDYIGDELDLGSYIATVLMGLFWGRPEEKEKTCDVLLSIRDDLLSNGTSKSRQIVERLLRFSEENPEIAKLRKASSLKITPAKRISTVKKLTENSVITTVIGVVIAVVTMILPYFPR